MREEGASSAIATQMTHRRSGPPCSWGLLAIFGEILNLWNIDPTTSGWFLSISIVVMRVLLFSYGMNMYAHVSEEVNVLGTLGSSLLFWTAYKEC